MEPAAGPAPPVARRGRGGTSAPQALLPGLAAIPAGAKRSGIGLAGELGCGLHGAAMLGGSSGSARQRATGRGLCLRPLSSRLRARTPGVMARGRPGERGGGNGLWKSRACVCPAHLCKRWKRATTVRRSSRLQAGVSGVAEEDTRTGLRVTLVWKMTLSPRQLASGLPGAKTNGSELIKENNGVG